MDDQQGERLSQRATAQRQRGRDLARDVAALAGSIAETEDELADAHENIVRAGISVIAADAGEHAAKARRFAGHERIEQQRWGSRSQEGQGGKPQGQAHRGAPVR